MGAEGAAVAARNQFDELAQSAITLTGVRASLRLVEWAVNHRRYWMKAPLSVLVAGAVAGLVVTVSCGRSERAATDPTFEVGCALIGPHVNPSSATLHPGDTLRVSAMETACDGTISAVFRWTTSDTSVATVGPSDGLVRARGRGTATIIASDVRDLSIKGAMALTVVQ